MTPRRNTCSVSRRFAELSALKGDLGVRQSAFDPGEDKFDVSTRRCGVRSTETLRNHARRRGEERAVQIKGNGMQINWRNANFRASSFCVINFPRALVLCGLPVKFRFVLCFLTPPLTSVPPLVP